MKNAPRHIHSDDTSELLSSYIDDAVDLVERRRVDKLLRECNACVVELEDLRGLRQLLRRLPAPMPRRSFTLDASVAPPRMRLFPIFRFASLAAALLLFVVLGVDALGRGSQGQITAASQPAAEVAPLTQEQSRTMDSAATAAPEAAAANEPLPAAGGAAIEPTTEAAAEVAPDAATLQAPATAAAATGEEQEVPAQGSPVEPTMGIAGAALEQGPGLDDEQNNESADAPADPDALKSSDALSSNDTSSPDTTTLEETQALQAEPVNRPWLDSWLVAEALLAALVVALGGATWWSARQERV